MTEQDFVDEVNNMAYEDMPMYARRNVDAGFNPDGSPRISGDGGNRGHGLPADELAAQNGGEKVVEPILDSKHGVPENEKIRAFLVDALATEEGIVAKTRNLFAIQDLKSYIQAETGLDDLDMSNRRNYLASSFATRHQGGPIKTSGTYELLAGEMVMDNQAAEIIKSSVSVAGAIMNQMMLEKIGGGNGAAATPTIVDAKTVNNVVNNNNTEFRSPSPSGQYMFAEKGDFVGIRKIA